VEEIFTVLANRMPQPVETTLPNAVSARKKIQQDLGSWSSLNFSFVAIKETARVS